MTGAEIHGLFGGEGKFTRFPMYSDTDAPPFTVIAETEMAPGARAGLHIQPDLQELLYVLTGAGELSIDGEISPVKAGDAILARAATNFSLERIPERCRLRYLVVKCPLC